MRLLDFSWDDLVQEAFLIGSISQVYTIGWLTEQPFSVYNKVLDYAKRFAKENGNAH